MEHDLIRVELFKNIEKFTNEIDLTMDFLNKNVVENIKSYIKSVNKNEKVFNSFIEYNTTHLKSYESQLSAILFSNQKIKSNYYNFLNDIVLFNNILPFKLFENESKNTKKDLMKYVYSIYMASVFLQGDISDENLLNDRLNEFVLKIKTDSEKSLKEEYIKQPKLKTRRNAITPLSNNLPDDLDMSSILSSISGMGGEMDMASILSSMGGMDGMTGMGDMGNIMESILGNKEILNIASDISKKMQCDNLNPMDMLTSLMSGNIENSPLQGLVEEIQQKVETKINSGEIDKENLETQAKNIMSNISNNPVALDSMGGMSELIKNMVSDLEKK